MKRQPFRSQHDADEDRLARAGFALVSAETARRIQNVEDRINAGLPVSIAEFEHLLYAIYCGAYGEHHRPTEFA